MLPRVELEAASLRQRNDQAPAQAATEQYSHNAEVEYHGGARVVVLDARHARVFDLDTVRMLLYHLGASWLYGSSGCSRLRICSNFSLWLLNHLGGNGSFRSGGLWLHRLLGHIREGFGLSENDWLLDLWLRVRIQLVE